MRTFSRTSSMYATNSPSLDKSTKRFTKLKQNLDIYNVRASNYKSALERTFERASQVEDYNYYGSFAHNFSTSTLSLSSKPSTSSQSFFSSNSSYSTSHSRRPAVRYNSNSAISPYNKNFTTTPSSTFNQKWNSKIDRTDNYSYHPYSLFNYDDIDTNDYNFQKSRNSLNSLSNIENNASNKLELKKNPKKENEIIFTPNRVQNTKKNIQEDSNDITFEIDKNDTFDDTIEAQNEVESKMKNKFDASDEVAEEEEEKVEIDLGNQNDELAILVEEEEINEKKRTNPSTKYSNEVHSQAYLNAMNTVNAKMKIFNDQLNSNQSANNKFQESNDELDIDNDSNKSDSDEIINEPIQNEEEDEFKKKQRVELEEIKSLYALLENELKKIQEESNNTNSNSGNDVNANEENEDSNEDLNEEAEHHSD